MNKETQKDVSGQLKAIFELDLELIKSKLTDSDGPGWTREQADACEIEYKRFLALTARYPDEELVPSVDVDTFWHTHILDTRKYAEDCEQVFGFFLHHTPHYGPKLEANAQKMGAAFARTNELCEELFGALGTSDAAWCVRAESMTDKAQAAWCVRAQGKLEQNAAWCVRAEGKANQDAAWCVRAQDKAEQQAAWCVRAQDKVEQNAAWCVRAEGKSAMQGAWCVRAAVKPELHHGMN